MARLCQEIQDRENDYKFLRDRQGHAWSVRKRNRCLCCGRPRGYLRRFKVCRLCFRQLSLRGEIPGVIKSSW